MRIQSIVYIAAFSLIYGCTTPRVNYKPIKGELDTTNADENGALIRMPRSIIKIVNEEPDTSDLKSTAIDPLPTVKRWLPLNQYKFAYTLDVISDKNGKITSESFSKIDGALPNFPFASCDYATLKIYGKSEQKVKLSVSAIPTEIELPTSLDEKATKLSPLYRATPVDDLLSTTTLKVTYFDNTLIPKTVAIETQDNVKEEIKTIASIVGTLVKAAAEGEETPDLEDMEQEIANITLSIANNKNYLLAPLPTKGSVTAHSTCGADVTDISEIKSSSQNGLDVLQTAISEGISLYKKAKGEDEQKK